ncbi:GntR family transcriptional regulator [Nonomuraea sp. NPDC049725]|uniref:GntR family transcriptional regulator n=1 Tax=Nonomuraea sp. NPDC049725 TaxID=3154508 RepID=UPI003447CF3A
MPRVVSESGSSVVERIAGELRERIKRGQLVGGQRLIEDDWTQELGVSRGPLREALGRLASEGLSSSSRSAAPSSGGCTQRTSSIL